MRRIILMLTVGTLMAVAMALSAVPASADPGNGAFVTPHECFAVGGLQGCFHATVTPSGNTNFSEHFKPLK